MMMGIQPFDFARRVMTRRIDEKQSWQSCLVRGSVYSEDERTSAAALVVANWWPLVAHRFPKGD